MKILYISNEYPPETGNGGIGTYTWHAAHALADLGHEVHVLCRSEKSISTDTHQQKVHVHRRPPGVYPLPSGKLWYPLRMLSYVTIPHALDRLAWAVQVRSALESLPLDFDIIESPECGAEGYFVRTTKKTKHVVRLHTPWTMVKKLDSLRERYLDTRLIGAMERSTARQAALVVSPSKALAAQITNNWRLSTAPQVLPNPLALRDFSLRHGQEWIFVGRIERRKGVHTLLDAYEKASHHQELPRLRLVGRAFGIGSKGRSYESQIRTQLQQPSLRDRVEWIEGAPQDRIRGFLRESSVAFVPSLWENCPYSCLEAMATGCAIVASEVGGLPEIITNESDGLLAPPEDPDTLADIMLQLARNPFLAQKLGENGRATISRRFDSAIVGNLLETAYLQLVEAA